LPSYSAACSTNGARGTLSMAEVPNIDPDG
jgi:hypothetical protein